MGEARSEQSLLKLVATKQGREEPCFFGAFAALYSSFEMGVAVGLAPKKPVMVEKKRLMVPLRDEEFEDLHKLAFKHGVTANYLANLAVIRLLLSDAAGEFSMIPEFQPEYEIPGSIN